jgi:hypothetical protein
MLQLVVAAIVMRCGSPQHSNHYFGALHDKLARLDQSEGKRLVLLGGSNVAFGIQSPVMQQSLGMETVNLGLHVALGLHFPLECYLQHARPGDVVLLCPEYHLLTSEEHQRGDAMTIHKLLEQCPDARRYFPGTQQQEWKRFLDHDALWIAHQWVGRAIRMLRARDRHDKVYARSSFNQHGDVVAHHGRESGNLMPMAPVPEPTPELVDQTVAILNEFYWSCREKGVTVYFSYPPYAQPCFEESEKEIQQIHLALLERVEMPILNQPETFVYQERCFFDSGYHLNQEVGAARTRAIASAIQQHHHQSDLVALENQPSYR